MSEDEMLKENFMNLLDEGCGMYNSKKEIYEYDHFCLSTYEQALKLALDFGWIKEEQLLRKL